MAGLLRRAAHRSRSGIPRRARDRARVQGLGPGCAPRALRALRALRAHGGMPCRWLVMARSQVRLQEACAEACAAWVRVADPLSSGCSMARSPAKAQRPQLWATLTCSAAAWATACRDEPRPSREGSAEVRP